MKIAIVCHPSIGGSGLVATQLGIGLAKLGHEIHFITSSMPFKLSGLEKNIYFHHVEAIHYPLFDDSLYTFALTAKIVEVVELHQLDLLHAHYSIPHSLCAYLAQQISKRDFPTVTTIHGTDVTIVGQDRPLYPLNRFSIINSSLVTTVSHYQKQYLLDHFELDNALNNDIEVIHNFIDLSVFKPDNKSLSIRRMLAKDDEKIILHASNFRFVKNTAGVVKSFALASKNCNARLVLIGDGPDIAEMRSLARELGVLDRVNFFGKVQNVEQVIANADCVFQPSYFESFGMVALEAMASGVPTVCSRVDGVPEVVVHNETGFLAYPDDHQALADYLSLICNDSDLAYKLGMRGREVAKLSFNWADKISQYEACYQQLLT